MERQRLHIIMLERTIYDDSVIGESLATRDLRVVLASQTLAHKVFSRSSLPPPPVTVTMVAR